MEFNGWKKHHGVQLVGGNLVMRVSCAAKPLSQLHARLSLSPHAHPWASLDLGDLWASHLRSAPQKALATVKIDPLLGPSIAGHQRHLS